MGPGTPSFGFLLNIVLMGEELLLGIKYNGWRKGYLNEAEAEYWLLVELSHDLMGS